MTEPAGPPWRLGHRPALDGLRGLAVLAVVAYHGWPTIFPGGWIGVEVFFVLSGFLITSLLIEEHAERGRISLRAFYVRRSRRLFPALAAFIIGCAVFGPWVGWRALAATGGYVTNLVLAFSPSTTVVFGHTWSLAMEEQYYLLWPLAMVLLLRLRPIWCLAATCSGIVATVGTRAILAAEGRSWTSLYYSPLTHADGLLAGCLLAQLLAFGWLLPQRRALWAGLVLVACFVAIRPSDPQVYGGGLVLIVMASGGVVLATLDGNELLEARWLREVGRRSYGLYLWHPLVFYRFGVEERRWLVVPAIAASGLVAWVSYKWIEKPFLRARSRTVVPSFPSGRNE